MEYTLDYFVAQLNVLLLVFSRIAGYFVADPIFGRNNLPNIFKLALSLSMSFLIFTTLDLATVEDIRSAGFFYICIISVKEFIIGLLIGYIVNLFFAVFMIAGGIVDTDVGFAMARIVDPYSGYDMSISGNFLFIFAALAYLAIDAHHQLIRLVAGSFTILPLSLNLNFRIEYLGYIIALIDDMFLYAVKIAIPVVIAMFVVNVVMGILARTMPQMNVFVVSMPLKIFVGIIMLYFVIMQYDSIMIDILKAIFNYENQLFRLIKGS